MVSRLTFSSAFVPFFLSKCLSHVHSLLRSTQPRKNGLWARNTSLPRDKEPRQSVRGLSPSVGISFLFHVQWLLFCLFLKHVYYMAPGQLWNLSSLGRGACFFHGGMKEMCICARKITKRDLLALGNQHPPTSESWFCSVSSLCK